MNQRMWLHQLVLVSTLAVITAWRYFTGRWALDIGILIWLLGAVIGFVFVFVDRIIDVYLSPDLARSKFVGGLCARRKYLDALYVLLTVRNTPQRLMIRSVSFLVAWVFLAALAMTSSVSSFGRGFVFGFGLHLCFDLCLDYFGKRRDINLWFWQIKRTLDENEIRAVVFGFLILFVLIAWAL